MQPRDAHERLLALARASMPPVRPQCIVCEATPSYLGTGVVDGTAYGYHLCEPCSQTNYSEAVTSKIRAWTMAHRRN